MRLCPPVTNQAPATGHAADSAQAPPPPSPTLPGALPSRTPMPPSPITRPNHVLIRPNHVLIRPEHTSDAGAHTNAHASTKSAPDP